MIVTTMISAQIDQRQHAEHGLLGDGAAVDGRHGGFSKGIERARANVAVNDADAAHGENDETGGRRRHGRSRRRRTNVRASMNSRHGMILMPQFNWGGVSTPPGDDCPALAHAAEAALTVCICKVNTTLQAVEKLWKTRGQDWGQLSTISQGDRPSNDVGACVAGGAKML